MAKLRGITHAPVLRRFRVRDETLAGTRVAGKKLLSPFGPLNVLYATCQVHHLTANTTVLDETVTAASTR